MPEPSRSRFLSTTCEPITTAATPLATGAVTGTFRAGFNVEIMGNARNKQANVRLYNVTDAVEYCFDSGDKEEGNRWERVAGFVYITLIGASKSIAIQFSSPEGVTVSCRRARIEFWKVA